MDRRGREGVSEQAGEEEQGGLTLGLRYMIASAFFFSVMGLLVKLAGQRLESSQIVLARASIALVMSWVAIKRLGISPWGESRRDLLFMRGALGFVGLSCYFWAVTKLPLGDASVIMHTNPLFVGVFAALFLGERWRGAELVAVVLGLSGVALIAQPSFVFGGEARLDGLAVGVAMLGAVVAASAYTSVRALSGVEHPMVVVFYFPLVATPLAIPWAAMDWLWPTPLEWCLLLGVGVATQIAQVFMTRGLHLERAGRATSVTYLQVAFSFVWGAIFFGERPTWLSGLGATLVVCGALAAVRARKKKA